jgi:hypothetical protein
MDGSKAFGAERMLKNKNKKYVYTHNIHSNKYLI